MIDFVTRLARKWCPACEHQLPRAECVCAVIATAIREALEEVKRTMDITVIRQVLGGWWAQEFPREVLPTEALERLAAGLAALRGEEAG